MATALNFTDGQLRSGDGTLTAHVNEERTCIPWAKIRWVGVREGRYFRHPYLGVVFGISLLLPSLALIPFLWLIRLAPYDWDVADGLLDRLVIPCILGIVVGAWVLWDVVRAPRICWLVVEMQSGRREWPVRGLNRAEVKAWLAATWAEAKVPA